MRHFFLLSLLLAAFPVVTANAQKPLFNGKDLTGWSGNSEFWRVEGGCIIGETTAEKPTKGNTFLIWEGGELKDFELTLEGRVLGNNSGIQYRSKVVDPKNWSVGGYQMDMIGNADLFGMLYEERGRGILARRGQKVVLEAGQKPKVIGQVDKSKQLDVATWNQYRIVARGNTLTHYVNGEVTAEITDNDAAKRSLAGVLAFQIHAGPPTRVELKDIVLKELKERAAKAVNANAEAAPTVPQWIWTRGVAGDETIYARRQWTQREPAKSAKLTITCDNGFTAFINGKRLGESSNWERAEQFDLAPHLVAGDNVLAIEATNTGNIGGLVAMVELVGKDGSSARIVTDKHWLVRDEKTDDWMAPSVDPAGWVDAFSLGLLGKDPWGNPFTGVEGPANAGKINVSQGQAEVVPEGFEIEKIYDVPKATQGSWVSMAVDDQGRLFCSDQRGEGIFRITLGDTETSAPVVEKIPAEITGSQGMLWAFGCLYVSSNGGPTPAGLYRVTDSDGDDMLDHVEKLRNLRPGGEHGIHAVVLGPDGKSIYSVAGNHSAVPEPETSAVPRNYAPDQLLPRMPDARGHGSRVPPPGGWIARTDRDGSAFHLFSAGFRNQYDAAFNAHGEMFTYDADMEWDIGTPWYRPTRMNHVTSGSEFGWRNGSGKFPAYYPDTLPAAVDVGPGSPTGVLSGLGAKFPAKYQNAIFAFDWTYGTIYAMHPVPAGSSYTMIKEEFVIGAPLNVTDGVIGKDGNFYFAVGGRNTNSAVYCVRYSGDEPTDPAPAAPGAEAPLRELRHQIEAFHRPADGAVDEVWPHLGHDDRFIRYAARVALEHQPVVQWADRALAEADTQASLTALLALTRQGNPEHQPALLAALKKIFSAPLAEAQRLDAYRVLGLAIIRMGELDPATAAEFVAILSPGFPATSDPLNRELVALLVALGAEDIVARTIPLMAQDAVGKEGMELNQNLIARAERYGRAFADTARSKPQRQQIWYAYALRKVTHGWTPELRRDFFTWFAKAQNFKGGPSFAGFIENIRKEALAAVADKKERAALATLSEKPASLVPAGYESARTITVGVKPGLKFATDLIEGVVGEKVAIEFVNDDVTGLMHNLAVITPGSLQKVIAASMKIGPDAVEKNFIPDIPEVLAATPQVAINRKFTLYFSIPDSPGDYYFICTYPGHGQLMNGVFRVTESPVTVGAN